MTVFQKPHKKKVMSSAISIIEKEKKLYAEIYQSDKGIVNTNHTLFQTSKEELAKNFLSKREAFRIKATIWKSEEKIRYALPNFHIKTD